MLDLSKRSLEIFRHVIQAYMETGEPIGSRTLSKRLGLSLSAATIRNIMADLEEAGLLYAPHTSAGRLPTEAGLRFFVHGLLEVGEITPAEQKEIDRTCQAKGRSLAQVLEETTSVLSGLSRCAGLVLAPKCDASLKHIEFIYLSPGRGLVVLVTQDGVVENRIIEIPLDIPPSSLTEASNFLSAKLVGYTLNEVRQRIFQELDKQQGQLDTLTKTLIQTGLATWAGDESFLIVKGQSNLLQEIAGDDDLARLKNLFDALEAKKEMMNLLDAAINADGVQIFIGSNNSLFAHTGCSLIVSPYKNGQGQIVGALGVIGPTRINYARVVSMVDYTAKIMSKLITV